MTPLGAFLAYSVISITLETGKLVFGRTPDMARLAGAILSFSTAMILVSLGLIAR